MIQPVIRVRGDGLADPFPLFRSGTGPADTDMVYAGLSNITKWTLVCQTFGA